ncbi:MAG: FHA domain-containing protein [Acetatifactor sp.]|nr:FHA domain-containing protein [Acetatifactor sp.]
MLQSEYIKSLHANYERILLDKHPDEKRYQYCILNRGGINGLIPCNLRYINGLSYLYYDITSKQNITQRYDKNSIGRSWVKDFVRCIREVREELDRFLLDIRNILWYPQQIFQDPEENRFSFFYVPYYDGESTFTYLMDYLVEHIDYEDSTLVDCIFSMYEMYEKSGDAYLCDRIYEDVKVLEMDETHGEMAQAEKVDSIIEETLQQQEKKVERKGFLHRLERKRKKTLRDRQNYEQKIQIAMSGYAVAEDTTYESVEYGKTIYIDDSDRQKNIIRRIYSTDGKILFQLGEESCVIGKKAGETDLLLEDYSVSRIHAKITKDGDEYFLEDLNSTNGTYKNGLQMQPYEKRKLEEGDEIRLGKVQLIYR